MALPLFHILPHRPALFLPTDFRVASAQQQLTSSSLEEPPAIKVTAETALTHGSIKPLFHTKKAGYNKSWTLYDLFPDVLALTRKNRGICRASLTNLGCHLTHCMKNMEEKRTE